MNLNPYQPPQTESSRGPFLKRLMHAWRRARKEYKAGLKRERFLRSEHFFSWVSLFAIVLILVLFGLFLVVSIVDFISRTDLTGICLLYTSDAADE